MHTGPVLTVRWAHNGRWLASGSDDEIVMVWDLDPNARGKVWGSDEVNVEGWKPLKRLPGHESDVTDVAWSPGDRYLASVGLDSMVIIWCGFTLERLHKLDQHQGFVKGVCWDPVGEFLATQSDDRSVKIWSTETWSLVAEVTKPFEDSPGSTFFRRLSWSPDGAHITASNATNNKGFVFIAAVITRNTWGSDISLVGHENTIEVAAYNPHIFLRDPSAPVATSNICSVVALGADDRSVSVWQTKSARPLIVAKEVFERQIMDLSWSWDGMCLYAASSDGTLAVFKFEPYELEGIASHSVQEQYLSKFGFEAAPIPEGYSHVSKDQHQLSPRSHSHSQAQMQTPPSHNFGPQANGTGERVNVLVAKRGKKKGGPITAANSIPSASTAPSSRVNGPTPRRASLLPIDSAPSNTFPTPEEQPFGDVDMVPIDAFEGKGKGRASDMDDSRPVYRTLGGDRPRDKKAVRELPKMDVDYNPASSSSSRPPQHLLPLPQLFTKISTEVTGHPDDVFEAENPEDDRPSEVLYISEDHTEWLDYVPSRVVALKATKYFCAAAMQDGTLNIYTRTGRRLLPTLSLGSAASYMDGQNQHLSVITTAGQLYSWKLSTKQPPTASFPPVSILPIFQSNPNLEVTSIAVHGTVPILNCTDGVMYSYDPKIFSWVKLSDKWWAEGSDVWPGKSRNPIQPNNRNIVAWLESNITIDDEQDPALGKERSQWWNSALTLGHLENKLHSCRLLDSPVEYKQALIVYAKKLGDEGFRAKAEELIRDLVGPVYWRAGDPKEEWEPTVVGLVKRDLLKEVLSQFVKSKTLTKLGLDWQDVLKKMNNEEV